MQCFCRILARHQQLWSDRYPLRISSDHETWAQENDVRNYAMSPHLFSFGRGPHSFPPEQIAQWSVWPVADDVQSFLAWKCRCHLVLTIAVNATDPYSTIVAWTYPYQLDTFHVNLTMCILLLNGPVLFVIHLLSRRFGKSIHDKSRQYLAWVSDNAFWNHSLLT